MKIYYLKIETSNPSANVEGYFSTMEKLEKCAGNFFAKVAKDIKENPGNEYYATDVNQLVSTKHEIQLDVLTN